MRAPINDRENPYKWESKWRKPEAQTERVKTHINETENSESLYETSESYLHKYVPTIYMVCKTFTT